MREISLARWHALASYCRQPEAALVSHELAWFESCDGGALATSIADADREFYAVILTRDGLERFRFVGATGPFESPQLAVAGLNSKFQELLPNLDELRIPGRRGRQSDRLLRPTSP